MKVWAVLSVDEASVVAVAATAELGKLAAQEDVGVDVPPLKWTERSDGRFRSTTWDYEVRPFDVIEAAEKGAA